MSNSLDPVQARRFVGPDRSTNCLQRSSVDDTSRQTLLFHIHSDAIRMGLSIICFCGHISEFPNYDIFVLT